MIFRFRLPPALLLGAPLGIWPRSTRATVLRVGEDGSITVTSVDHHESYGRDQVLKLAAAFLRAVDRNVPPTVLAATLEAPSTRDRGLGYPARYSIALGAAVSITRVLIEEPVVTIEQAPALSVCR